MTSNELRMVRQKSLAILMAPTTRHCPFNRAMTTLVNMQRQQIHGYIITDKPNCCRTLSLSISQVNPPFVLSRSGRLQLPFEWGYQGYTWEGDTTARVQSHHSQSCLSVANESKHEHYINKTLNKVRDCVTLKRTMRMRRGKQVIWGLGLGFKIKIK